MVKKSRIDFSSLSLVVYQNELFIDGLYQAINNGMEEEAVSKNSKEKSKAGKAEVNAGFKVPLTPIKAGAKVGGEAENATKEVFTQKMTYSNAYRLHQVRQEFYTHNEIKKLNTKKAIEDIKLSDFVEFQATFEKNDFSELLDLISPDLGGVIGYTTYMSGIKKAQNNVTPLAFDQKEADGKVALGRSIVESLQKEFRNETSSEFYGTICNSSGNTIGAKAVVVCDKQFFTNGDSDRLLDGVFSVFGKVIAINKTGSEFSKFERNKLLKRIKPKGVEWLQSKLKEMKDINDYFKTDIELSIDGVAIKVIPVAIYV